MSKKPNRHPPRSRAKKGSGSYLYVAVAIILLFVVGFYFYVRQNPSTKYPYQVGGSAEDGAQPGSPENLLTENGKAGQQSLNASDSIKEAASTGAEMAAGGDIGIDPGTAVLDETEQLSSDITKTAEKTHQYLIDRLNRFYEHLDQQPYMQAFNLEEPSRVHFSKLIQKAVDNPPVVTRETDDLFTLLKNTAHFFRVLGKNNIIILKGILDREKDSFEDILQTLYTLTLHPEYLQEEYGISLPFNALYDYAGFFLNTMGGRLYLFRRDSASRMVVSYYAILVVDRAGSESNENHGIDLRPAIDFLINEIETGGTRLQLRDQYLDTLYDLKEKYN